MLEHFLVYITKLKLLKQHYSKLKLMFVTWPHIFTLFKTVITVHQWFTKRIPHN